MNLHHHMVDKDKRYCPICDGKIPLASYTAHISECYKFSKDSTLIKLPKEGTTMKFNNHKNKLIRPYIAYFDFECSLCETGDEEKIAKHEPNSVCYYLVNTKDPSKNNDYSNNFFKF